MKNIKLAKTLWFFNCFYFLIYNIYFGFNLHSHSVAETNCDTLFKIIFYVVLIIYLMPLFQIYEKAVKLFLGK
jgi:hypothetical protein